MESQGVEDKKPVENNELKLGIGDEETTILKPTNVKIVSVEIKEFGKKLNRKVICCVNHPDVREPIHISSVKFEKNGKLETSGLWINKDNKGFIRKGCALAIFLNLLGCKTIEELKGKEAQTTQDDKGWLCFKAY